ncbi:MAG: hypothetical protein ACYTEL_15300 [Planctomycetota bacterium]|jgi:membrane protein DedA with SNARE-associated domain
MIMTIIASLLNGLLLVMAVALLFRLPATQLRQPGQLFGILLLTAVPVVNLVALWYQRIKAKRQAKPPKNLREKLDQMHTLLEEIAGRS